MRILKQVYVFFDLLINSSIKNRIILFFSLLIIFSMAFLGTFSYNKSSEILVDEVVKSTSNLVGQTVTNVNAYFEDIKYTVIYIATNPIVIDRIKGYSTDLSINYEEQKREMELINGIVRVKSNIFDILVVSKDGLKDNANSNQYLNPQYDFFKQIWLMNAHSKKNHEVKFISLHPQDYYALSSYNTVKEGAMTVSASLLMDDPSFYNIQGKTAFVMCDFKLDNLNKLFESLNIQNGGSVLLVDNEGKVIFHSDKDRVGEKIDNSEYRPIFINNSGSIIQKINNKKELLIYSTIKSSGWKVAATIPMDNIYDKSKKIRDVTLRVALVCMLLVILLSIMISTGITRPLHRLIKHMRYVEEGKLDIKITRTGYGEVAALERQFRGMLDRIHALIKDVYQTKIKQKEAEFDALQSQINPHFLYNTLQMIKAEAVINDDTKVSQMITSLGYLLRYAVYDKNEMVFIKDEVEYIKNYLYIYSQRFEEKISFELSIDENTLYCKIPKLILQPIVENSITHAFNERSEAGKIKLIIKLTDNSSDIWIEIYDNGCGIEENKLKEMINRLNIQSDEKSIGLRNVHERIRLKFGESYGIRIASKHGEYTSVKVWIPAVSSLERGEPDA